MEDLLRPFTTAKDLYLPKELVRRVRALREPIGVIEVLPILHNISLEELQPRRRPESHWALHCHRRATVLQSPCTVHYREERSLKWVVHSSGRQ